MKSHLVKLKSTEMKLKRSTEFPHVIQCTEETASQVWILLRKRIMNIDPDLVFRSRKNGVIRKTRIHVLPRTAA